MNWIPELKNGIIMREVRISGHVMSKIDELESFLKNKLKLSKEAAHRRSNRMRIFVYSLSNIGDYPLCRFKKWRIHGYRCAVFEKTWIFAYEVFDGGVIVQDMSHTYLLTE